jgi:glycosyltransferase involved in cell wall biosynthesis
MPRVILEAASMGRISIVTDVPGCREAVKDRGTGFLCKARSVESLVAALHEAASLNPQQINAMGSSARRRALESFSIEKAIEPYLAIANGRSVPARLF